MIKNIWQCSQYIERGQKNELEDGLGMKSVQTILKFGAVQTI